MCGIAGIVYQGGPMEEVAAAVRRMVSVQRHRGPDGEGFYDGCGVSLGHCRLAIIDLSENGRQPMSDRSGRYWITFNGEIYNYVELSHELGRLGWSFRGQSDTEVLLAAYQQWGESCLDRLRGMFAFAVWDEHQGVLFAARDRLGIKPFHYWTDGATRLAFSSELKALLEFLPERRANVRLAREYIAWNLLDHDTAETMVAGIQRLPAAHAMTWRPGGSVIVRRYWNLTVNESLDTPADRRAALISEFRNRFEETISIHLRSDVPVGTCLSGGLDSSSIACAVRNELGRLGAWREAWQHTFSACFNDPRLDERRYIGAVAAATGCHTHFVFPSGQRLREEIDTWLWHQEEPVGGSGAYAQYCVARLAHEHGIKVLLDGQGADEQLAGYRKFILTYLRQLIHAGRWGKALREMVAFSSVEILQTSRLVDGRRYLFAAANEAAELWPHEDGPCRPEELALGTSLSRRLKADLTRFSLPLLLRYEDRNTMAFGIESRVPFVDHALVEWIATLAADMRLAGGWTKFILREGLKDVLPPSVQKRKTKLGFLTPESVWLAGPLADWFAGMLRSPRHLAEVIDVNGARRLFARYSSGDRTASVEKLLFRLAIYESWARLFLEARTPKEFTLEPCSCHPQAVVLS